MPKNIIRFEPGSIEYQTLHPAVGAHGYSGGVAESAAQASGIPRAIEGSGAPVMHFLLTAELPGGAFGGQQKKLELFAFEMWTAGFHIPVDDLGGSAAHLADDGTLGIFGDFCLG